jgi:hypothetical protein
MKCYYNKIENMQIAIKISNKKKIDKTFRFPFFRFHFSLFFVVVIVVVNSQICCINLIWFIIIYLLFNYIINNLQLYNNNYNNNNNYNYKYKKQISNINLK